MNTPTISCFSTGWAALLDADLWAKWLDILAKISTVLAVIVALLAARIAYKQFVSSIKETRNATAYSIYHQYLTLCLDKPQLSSGMQKPHQHSVEYDKYRWFVSSMLFTFEQILDTQKDDPKWIKTITSQLKIHKHFLATSRTVRDKEWDEQLQTIIDDVLNLP
jgi:hypothetical protein